MRRRSCHSQVFLTHQLSGKISLRTILFLSEIMLIPLMIFYPKVDGWEILDYDAKAYMLFSCMISLPSACILCYKVLPWRAFWMWAYKLCILFPALCFSNYVHLVCRIMVLLKFCIYYNKHMCISCILALRRNHNSTSPTTAFRASFFSMKMWGKEFFHLGSKDVKHMRVSCKVWGILWESEPSSPEQIK